MEKLQGSIHQLPIIFCRIDLGLIVKKIDKVFNRKGDNL